MFKSASPELTLRAFRPGLIYASARKLPPAAQAAKDAANAAHGLEATPPRKGYLTACDITIESIVAGMRKLKRENPAEYKRQRRIERAYSEGDFDLAIVMDEQGVGERKARNILAEEAYWRDLRKNDPAEVAFQVALDWWKANAKRLLKAGEISYEAVMASSVPMHHDVPPASWPRIQAWLRENVPLTAGQLAAYELGYYQRQRAHALALFGLFTPERRAQEWRASWQNEKPVGWWDGGGDTKAWTIWRAELQRMIADDARGTF